MKGSWSDFNLKWFLQTKHRQLVKEYILTPIGSLLVLCFLYAVNRLIKDVIKITFPASVTTMILNFVFMCVLSATNKKFANVYVKYVDIPLGWSLRWMNLFFTPAFVMLPTSGSVKVKEAIMIIATFIVGYLVGYVVVAYLTMICQRIFYRKNKSSDLKLKTLGSPDAGSNESSQGDSENNLSCKDKEIKGDNSLLNTAINSKIGIHSPQATCFSSYNEKYPHGFECKVYQNSSGIKSRTRSNTTSPLDHGQSKSSSVLELTQNAETRSQSHLNDYYKTAHSPDTEKQTSVQKVSKPEPLTPEDFIMKHLHHIIYTIGFCVAIVCYFIFRYNMPLHFFTAICTFMLVNDVPLPINPKYRRFIHPVIVSVTLTWLFMLILILIKHHRADRFISELRDYQIGRNYLDLLNTTGVSDHSFFGAGDIFSSCMDISIVGLSMPMFTYRYVLRKNFMNIIPPIIVLSFGSLIFYPLIGHKIGIGKERSIGFIGRSATLALSTPLIKNLNGSITLMAVTTVSSGLIGAMSGGPMLGWLGVPSDDYITRGVTMGTNCGAIATAYLLSLDKRAAAISSLSFVFFGTFMVILSSMGFIKSMVERIVTL